MKNLRFAVVGTGFWANYQIPAWYELEGVELVALYNRTLSKAEALARKFNVPSCYDSFEKLLDREQLDFVDIITDVDTHAPFTLMAAERRINIICQKPMAANLASASLMVESCHSKRVKFFIHENWRWQAPIRKLKQLIDAGAIGEVFKGRVTFTSAFPVFDNQPFLAQLDEFILTDIGSHILDVCRFLFGEVNSLLCHTATVNKNIRGEDVASVFMKMESGVSCFVEMSYATVHEHEPFPQTFVLVEGSTGTAELRSDHIIVVSTRTGTQYHKADPVVYSWADPAYALVHSSIVDCNRNLLEALKGDGKAETTGEDNLKTVKLVHAAYASARKRVMVHPGTVS